MERTVTTISDPETVPLRLEFDAHISEHDWAVRINHLYRELTERLPQPRLGVELALLAQEKNTAYLHVGWIAPEETDVAFDCLERAFPEAIAALLGDGAHAELYVNSAIPPKINPNEFVLIPEKEVEFEDGRRVLVPSFQIGRHPVTVGQFLDFVDATDYITTAESEDNYETFRANALIDHMSPEEMRAGQVYFVSKKDALAYCDWSSTHLPSEAEWLAAMVLDWTPLDPGRAPSPEQGRLRKNALVPGMAEWTNSVDPASGQSIVRSAPMHFLQNDWRTRCGHRLCSDDHYEIVITFRVVKGAPH